MQNDIISVVLLAKEQSEPALMDMPDRGLSFRIKDSRRIFTRPQIFDVNANEGDEEAANPAPLGPQQLLFYRNEGARLAEGGNIEVSTNY